MTTQLKIRCLLALLSMAAVFAAPAHAKYVGPGSTGTQANVASILERPVDDQDVSLQGRLLRKAGHEKYIFSDGSGEIVAEIDDDDFPADPITEKTRVQIRGEVDTGRDRPPEIEVKSLKIVQ